MRFSGILAALAIALAAGPATAQQRPRVWAIALPKEGDAVLRFAFINSTDLMLGYTCKRGSGQIHIIAASPVRITEPMDPDAPPATPIVVARPATVTVSSGPATATLPGKIMPDVEYGGSSIVTEISSGSPVIAEFRRTGYLRVTVLNELVDAPPAPSGMLRAFLNFCR